MKDIIKLINWHTRCGDGCCDDYGTRLIINDVIVDNDFFEGEKFIVDIMKSLGIVDYEIIYGDDAE